MSAEIYTPDTAEVRAKYKISSGMSEEGYAEFDRWLVSHEVKLLRGMVDRMIDLPSPAHRDWDLLESAAWLAREADHLEWEGKPNG